MVGMKLTQGRFPKLSGVNLSRCEFVETGKEIIDLFLWIFILNALDEILAWWGIIFEGHFVRCCFSSIMRRNLQRLRERWSTVWLIIMGESAALSVSLEIILCCVLYVVHIFGISLSLAILAAFHTLRILFIEAIRRRGAISYLHTSTTHLS